MNIDTDKRELIDRRDAIEAVTDYIFFDVYGGMKPIKKCETEAKSILSDFGRIPPLLSEVKVVDECQLFLLKLLTISKIYTNIDTWEIS